LPVENRLVFSLFSVLLISDDENNMVVEKDSVPFEPPYNAVYVNNPHPRWTAQNDLELVAANARWIWEDDPTKQEDTQVNTTYAFENNFEWWGDITGSDLYMAVGSDNSVVIYLNDVEIGKNDSEYGYQQEHMLYISGAIITANVEQGNNVLRFEVTNWGQANGNPTDNPAGLIYKFEIDGLCGDDYFKTHCSLWGEKDLGPDDRFWMFDDIKPGDHGKNILSLHVHDNDAWACMYLDNMLDDDNGLVEPESEAGDDTETEGELSQFIDVFMWWDVNENNQYDAGDLDIVGPSKINDLFGNGGIVGLADADKAIMMEDCQTRYLGIAWCAGDMTVNEGDITCCGDTMTNIAQSDIFSTDIVFYTVQHRNNTEFSCQDLINGDPELK
jgi:hypothetical protein